MKNLLLIRHAKTELKGSNDKERKLAGYGYDECKIMSERLETIGFMPDLIMVSSAIRAIQTANTLAKQLDLAIEKIEVLDNLYLASYEIILNEIANTNNRINSLAIVGHNPGMTDLFNSIGNAPVMDIPTCGMGLFIFKTNDWIDISTEKGNLDWYSWPGKEN